MSFMDFDIERLIDENRSFEDLVPFNKNQDYQLLIRTLNQLKVEKKRCVEDIIKLKELQFKACNKSYEFARMLLIDDSIEFPQRIKITEVPEIDWSFYEKTAVNCNLIKSANTLTNKNITTTSLNNESYYCLGNIKNKWTLEEQENLEKLLIVYPPEEVESKRWSKIAIHLPNRTPRQVASRVQKYFIKLAKAGLPIPGRAPNIVNKRRTSRSKINLARYRNSSFFPTWNPQITMSNHSDYSNEDDSEFKIENDHLEQEIPDNSDFIRLVVVANSQSIENLSCKAKSTECYKNLLSLLEIQQSFLD